MANLILLPSEIRLLILHHLLVQYPRRYSTRRSRSPGLTVKLIGEQIEISNAGFLGLSAQILQVNRQLHSEGLPILYRDNVFNFETFENRFWAPAFINRWARIFGDNVRFLRHIDINDVRIRHLGRIFSMSPNDLVLPRGFLDRAQGLESMRILVNEIYDVPFFDTSRLEVVVDAVSEAHNRSVSEQYQIGVILEASRLLKEAGWQSRHWYEAKEKYYVEPVFYVTKYPLGKLHKDIAAQSVVSCPDSIPLLHKADSKSGRPYLSSPGSGP